MAAWVRVRTILSRKNDVTNKARTTHPMVAVAQKRTGCLRNAARVGESELTTSSRSRAARRSNGKSFRGRFEGASRAIFAAQRAYKERGEPETHAEQEMRDEVRDRHQLDSRGHGWIHEWQHVHIHSYPNRDTNQDSHYQFENGRSP